MIDRRKFLKLTGLALLSSQLSPQLPLWAQPQSVLVNDMHSQLNPTRVSQVQVVTTASQLCAAVKKAARQKKCLAICGARHAGGGQQFATDALLIDISQMNKILSFDQKEGTIEVESGIHWPKLLAYLDSEQVDSKSPWGINQKQTGGDELTLGGALGANAHGQGLSLRPIIADVQSFVLINAKGEKVVCSRQENFELFRYVIGGYGLFGLIYSIKLKLVPRCKVERCVAMVEAKDLVTTVERCISDGFVYGHYQLNIDNLSKDFMRSGIFTSYKLLAQDTPVKVSGKKLTDGAWLDLVYGAHTAKGVTFEKYANYYLSTSGQVDWSDVWQTGPYVENYHSIIDKRMHAAVKSTEVLSEFYVPRAQIANFIEDVRADFLANDVDLLYTSIRFIEKDTECFLAWAKSQMVCVILNLHTVHTKEGIEKTKQAMRRVTDLAIKYQGSYYLTYHKFADKNQVLACYPQIREFFAYKLKMDPQEVFQSDWYRHMKALVG